MVLDIFLAYLSSIEAQSLYFAALFGIIIGVEREISGKDASIRTFSLISIGSCLFTIISIKAGGSTVTGDPYDLTRISAQIVSGVGFLGGGVIFKTSDRIEGITTAALIWLTAALGMACGFGQYLLVTVSFGIIICVHLFSRALHLTVFRSHPKRRRHRGV